MILLATYDLHNPGRDYEKVKRVLETARSHQHPMGSVWLLDTSRPPAKWRDLLTKATDGNDEFFIVQLRKHWASDHLDAAAVTWLKDPARSWT